MIGDYMKGKALSFVLDLIKELTAYSYWICLLTAIVATMLYVAGLKRAGKYVPVMMVVYFLLECLKTSIGELQ